MRKDLILKVHDLLVSFAIFATALLLIVPPYGLLAGFSSDSLCLLMALWGEILYMALSLFARAVARDRDEFRRIESFIKRSGAESMQY